MIVSNLVLFHFIHTVSSEKTTASFEHLEPGTTYVLVMFIPPDGECEVWRGEVSTSKMIKLSDTKLCQKVS